MTEARKPASVLILGSGPVVIGQAAEFDYAGTQACRALRAEGVRTILVNSNPATIMTDPHVADAIYLEPLTVEAVEAVIAKERPEGLLAGLGGQTALNLATALADAGVFERHSIRLLGTPLEAIRMAEDREAFRDLLDRIGQPYAPSCDRRGRDRRGPRGRLAGRGARRRSACPAIVRPAFTLGGTGGGIVETEAAYRERVRAGLRASPIGQVMVERCLVGWQEIEYEVMRDADDTCIAVCSMENVDPLGVHTGDSIVVAPGPDPDRRRPPAAAQRGARDHPRRSASRAAATSSSRSRPTRPSTRSSRSTRASVAISALASKATGYPIARVAAQIAVGRRLAEIPNVVTGTTVAAFEPALDYVVVKLPRFPFDKFPGADRTLGSQMKATGEVMAIDRTFGSALNKALRGLEQAGVGPLAEDPSWTPTFDYLAGVYAGDPEADEPIRWIDETGQACESTRHAQRTAAPIVLRRFLAPSDSRLWRLLGLLRRGVPEAVIGEATGISAWFLAEMGRNVALEAEVQRAGARLADPADGEAATLLATVKRAGFGDRELAGLSGTTPDDASGGPARARPAARLRDGRHVRGGVRGRDPVLLFDLRRGRVRAGGAAGRPPGGAGHRLGPGPDRAGDRVRLLRGPGRRHAPRAGLEAVMINSNPETVSTDFDASSRLYFEPLDPESVRSVIDAEIAGRRGASCRPSSRSAARRRSTSPAPLAAGGVPLLGSDLEAIDQAEERTRFSALLDRLGIPQPEGGMAHSVEEALTLAERIGYPVIVRPSLRDRRPGDRLLLLAGGPRTAAGGRDRRRSRPARPHRPLPRGRRGRRRRRLGRRAGPHPRAPRAHRAGRASTAATRSASSRRRP